MPKFDSRVQWPGWETVRLIGLGSRSVVYEIRKTESGVTQSAVLKFVPIPRDDEEIETLRGCGYESGAIARRYESCVSDIAQEYAMWTAMKKHPNIALNDDIRYARHSDGIGWDVLIKTELLTPLETVVKAGLSDELVKTIGVDISRALSDCAAMGPLPFDVRPKNIFAGKNGTFKLRGFDAVETINRKMNGLAADTYQYMAPEVYRSQKISPNSCVYSLGLTLYALMNENRLPFLPLPPEVPTPQQEEQARQRRMNGEAFPPPKNGSEELKRAVMAACEPDPERRCSAKELMEMLRFRGAPAAEQPAEEKPAAPVPVPAERPAEKAPAAEPPAEEKPAAPVPAPAERPAEKALAAEPPATPAPQGASPKTETPSAPPRRKKLWIPLAGVGAAAVLLGVLLLTGVLGDRKNSGGAENTQAPQSTGTVSVQPSAPADIGTDPTAAPGSAAETPKPDAPRTDAPKPDAPRTDAPKLEWTEWDDKLPGGITAEGYAIECRQVYRTTKLVTVTGDGEAPGKNYKLFSGEYGEWGEWGKWQEEEITEDEATQVEKKDEQKWTYRYRSSTNLRDVPAGVAYAEIAIEPRRSTRYEWAEPISSELVTMYRSRTRELISRNYYDDTAWSSFTDVPVRQQEGTLVGMKMQYRYAKIDGSALHTPSMDNFAISGADYAGHYLDVADDAWYGPKKSNMLQTVDELGILLPDSSLRFRPDENMTVGQLIRAAVMIQRIYQGYTGIICQNDGNYQAYADYAEKAGMIVKGEFPDLNREATRQELAYLFDKALPRECLKSSVRIDSFTDLDASRKYFDSALALARAGVMSADKDGAFRPDDNVTRAQAAALIEKLVHPDGGGKG